jgi:hypothetical protein
METGPRGRGSIIDRVESPYQRSKLFEWLVAHYDEMVARSARRRIEWQLLCADFANKGLTDGDGKPANARTARMTWWRVRKEKARIDALRAAERAERAARRAADPRRNTPSRFPKGEYGPPLVALSATKPELPATTVQQAKRGLQLSTADGVVVTKAGRVVKLEEGGEDFVFDEEGIIAGTTNRAAVLRSKQQVNRAGRRPINDGTAEMYAKLGLRSEEQ